MMKSAVPGRKCRGQQAGRFEQSNKYFVLLTCPQKSAQAKC